MHKNNIDVNKFPFKDLNPYIFVVIIIIIVFFTYQMLGSIFVMVAFGEKFLELENMSLGRFVTIISQFLLILFPVYLLNYLAGNNIQDGFSLRKTNFIYYLLSIAGIIIIQPALQFYMFLQEKAIENLPFSNEILELIKKISEQLETYTVKLVTANNYSDLILIIFAVALTPAICEELMFRGLILNSLVKTEKIKYSIILTGLIFSIFHFHPFNIIPLFFLGIYLSIVTYYSRSIYPAILVHFINNLISILAVYFYGKEIIDDYQFIENNIYSFSIFTFVTFILFVFITYYIIIKGKKDMMNEQSG
ncbi:MAG: CPBP family intramembrane metalloprotease [Ignavibacteria bacterium]|nr:CPBP family intramembrane metalloprotease [Ignavibacteria bacterium]